MTIDLVRKGHQQTSLILDDSTINHEAESKLSKAMDVINNRYGRGTIVLGAQGNENQLNPRADMLALVILPELRL